MPALWVGLAGGGALLSPPPPPPCALRSLVLDALDSYKVTFNEPLRYTTLVCEMQSEGDNWALKCRLMLFINELLNVEDIGERIEIRADFLYAGLKDVIDVGGSGGACSPLRACLCGASKVVGCVVARVQETRSRLMSVIDPDADIPPPVLAAATAFQTQVLQLCAGVCADVCCCMWLARVCARGALRHVLPPAQVEVFGVLLADDTAEAVFDTTSLCEPESLFSAVLHTAVENGAFRNILGLLQRLLLIPAEWGYGRGMWQEVENAAHRCVSHCCAR